jgi:uncharacterized Zn finger protein
MSPAAPRPRKSAPSGNSSRDRRADGLRRVRAGVKLRARNGVIARTPLAERWLRLVEELVDHEELSEGLRYAKLGQIVTLEPQDGAIAAEVQGRATKPYATRIVVSAYEAEQWDRIIDAMAGEAVYLVKLLADELPEGIDALLAAEGLALLPATAEELTLECNCKETKPCRHAAAIGYLFTEQLSNDPLLVFALRGMPAERLLDRLRHTRAIRARGVAAAHVDPMIPETQEEVPPLESSLDDFWRPGSALARLQEAPPAQHLPHALLRRLGPSPLEGRFPFVGLLASIYDTVGEYAVRLRDHAEHLDEPDDDGDDG